MQLFFLCRVTYSLFVRLFTNLIASYRNICAPILRTDFGSTDFLYKFPLWNAFCCVPPLKCDFDRNLYWIFISLPTLISYNCLYEHQWIASDVTKSAAVHYFREHYNLPKCHTHSITMAEYVSMTVWWSHHCMSPCMLYVIHYEATCIHRWNYYYAFPMPLLKSHFNLDLQPHYAFDAWWEYV